MLLVVSCDPEALFGRERQREHGPKSQDAAFGWKHSGRSFGQQTASG